MDALARWILQQLEERNTSMREASLDAGLNQNYIRDLISEPPPGRKKPKLGAAGAKALAKYFNVTPDLLHQLEGRDQIPEASAFVKAAMADPLFQEIAEFWQLLKDDQRRSLHEFSRYWVEENRAKPTAGS